MLLRILRHFARTRAADIRERWDRSVSFGDLVQDRFERARSLGFGEGSSIYDQSLVLGDVRVGVKTWVGPYTVLDGSGGLTVGSHCSISAGVQVYTHDAVAHATSGGERPIERSPTCIGDRVYLGPGAIISRGAVIADGVVVGALSFVPEGAVLDAGVWVGAPVRRVR